MILDSTVSINNAKHGDILHATNARYIVASNRPGDGGLFIEAPDGFKKLPFEGTPLAIMRMVHVVPGDDWYMWRIGDTYQRCTILAADLPGEFPIAATAEDGTIYRFTKFGSTQGRNRSLAGHADLFTPYEGSVCQQHDQHAYGLELS